jgi:peptidoglycan/LPS O-acetylase OafA/YrhL
MGHREDIDGLRACAVVIVILFHAQIPGFGFGFWGVDVFLVISGFLITGIITRDVDAHRFSLVEFWTRRMRRLMPAAATVIVATALAVAVWGSPLEWNIAGSDALFSSVYLLNLSLGLREFSYFEANAEVRPYLHMWSLALEEQFYVVWPVVLSVALKRSRRAALVVCASLGALSFVLCAVASSTSPTQAFFLLPTRLWEFAVGAGLALASPTLSPGARRLASVGALLAFGVAVVWLTPMTALPGVLTALPVMATALLLVSEGGVVRPLLTARPMRWLGERSYSLYLWHWPVLVLGRPLLGDSAWATAALLAITIVAASASWALVEHRLRFAPTLLASRRRSWAVVAAFAGAGLASGAALRAGEAWTKRDPLMIKLHAVREDSSAFTKCTPTPCGIVESGTRRILVVGDSHAMQWIPAVEAAARDLDAKVFYAGRDACPGLDVKTVRPERRDTLFPECAAWHDELEHALDAVAADVVVVANFDGYLAENRIVDEHGGHDMALAALSAASEKLAQGLARRGAGVVFVTDIPKATDDPIRCAARRRTLIGCDPIALQEAERTSAAAAMLAPFQRTGAVIVDGAALACPSGTCPLLVDGMVTYRDRHHVTKTFSRAQAPTFRAAIARALAHAP